eukprot:2175307-Prymnesium_polylepis.1
MQHRPAARPHPPRPHQAAPRPDPDAVRALTAAAVRMCDGVALGARDGGVAHVRLCGARCAAAWASVHLIELHPVVEPLGVRRRDGARLTQPRGAPERQWPQQRHDAAACHRVVPRGKARR